MTCRMPICSALGESNRRDTYDSSVSDDMTLRHHIGGRDRLPLPARF
ncbi:hypothetical protein L083_7460 [Actinoplanes sp. N902-109]|nr:hypothetical protein L083_7460 [Actinoplanes sp. N902-109]